MNEQFKEQQDTIQLFENSTEENLEDTSIYEEKVKEDTQKIINTFKASEFQHSLFCCDKLQSDEEIDVKNHIIYDLQKIKKKLQDYKNEELHLINVKYDTEELKTIQKEKKRILSKQVSKLTSIVEALITKYKNDINYLKMLLHTKKYYSIELDDDEIKFARTITVKKEVIDEIHTYFNDINYLEKLENNIVPICLKKLIEGGFRNGKQ